MDLACHGVARKFSTMTSDEEPPVTTTAVDIHPHGAWNVVVEWPPGGGPRNPVSITIRSAPDADPQEIARGITTTVLRGIDIPAMVAARAEVDAEVDAWAEASELGPGELASLAAGGITDLYLATLARVYVNLVNQGNRAPAQQIARWGGVNSATLKGHLREARKRGLLTKVEGRAGGELTPKASRLLDGGNAHGEGVPKVQEEGRAE